MEILLPAKENNEQLSIECDSIVVIGANGSGKTRFGTDIENRFNNITHRISAQKSLSMPKEVSPKSKLRAESEFLYGNYNENKSQRNFTYKNGFRWGNNPNTYLLNDFDKLMILLHTEEYEESIKFKEEYEPGQKTDKPLTKLDIVKKIWEFVLPHRKLVIKAGSIETYPSDNEEAKYNASEMSDGERVVFYLIGEVISVPNKSIVIIDEPEMHIHKSITKKLWDRIEKERNDCTFIYLTHDIDFTVSRHNSTKIWAKSYNGQFWDYEILEDTCNIPDQVYLEILGSRKPIIFIEGDESSIDYKLLQLVYDDFTIKPLGSCRKVFETTKSFNENFEFHQVQSFGLIDRDRRMIEDIENINDSRIWITEVAEIENFLLLEEVIKVVANQMMKDSDAVFDHVKLKIIKLFENEIEKQALQHTISRIDKIMKKFTQDSNVETFDELNTSLSGLWHAQDFSSIYNNYLNQFKEYIDNGNYNEILKVFNYKRLVYRSDVITQCGLNTKNDTYLNFILSILKRNDSVALLIINAVKTNIREC